MRRKFKPGNILKAYVRHRLVRVTGLNRFYHVACGKVIEFEKNAHPGYTDKIANEGETVTCKACLATQGGS